jgi:hypothetical protein
MHRELFPKGMVMEKLKITEQNLGRVLKYRSCFALMAILSKMAYITIENSF